MVQQLFKAIPPVELVIEVLGFFGVVNFNESYKFSRVDIAKRYVIERMLKVPFEDYYINCKYQKYFTDMDEKKCITVLRQLLKIYDYKVISLEKFCTGKKHLTYHIAKITQPPPKNGAILEFD